MAALLIDPTASTSYDCEDNDLINPSYKSKKRSSLSSAAERYLISASSESRREDSANLVRTTGVARFFRRIQLFLLDKLVCRKWGGGDALSAKRPLPTSPVDASGDVDGEQESKNKN
ncbi:hypothetical protein ACA910_002633 [Epithemia clementina (nom. ined.)]